jgi:hypothetical protein
LDHPKIEAANDNVRETFLVPVEIPAEKKAAREILAAAMARSNVTITVEKAKDRPKQRPWRPSVRHAANDNLQSWPLLEKLKRDGLHEDAELVEHYRGLVALMEAHPLQGQDPSRTADGLSIADRTSFDNDDIEEAAARNFEGKLSSGEMINKGERVTTKANGTASRARPTDDQSLVVMRPVSVRFNEHTLIAQIDLAGVLPRLRKAMGPVTAPFEDAVLGGLTFKAVGEARQFKDKQAEAAGKALVMTAIDALREEWATIRTEQRQAEEQAERNVERRRREIAAEQARYMGRAA